MQVLLLHGTNNYIILSMLIAFFFSSRRRHTRFSRDWSSDVYSSDLTASPSRAALAPPTLTLGPTAASAASGGVSNEPKPVRRRATTTPSTPRPSTRCVRRGP